ncbi:MAG TPA: hypothetical protein DEP48_04495 [Persephonella sp.]|uniref:Uncharacterized protein n=1 Tax=Persephonella marina (strain DSM 14350 / EX-H1) TaxID=123214 RepID=C0QQ43_PERMH|nr:MULTISPECIES: hypothetical protein [Persephonella]ACO03793.1 conserved hypothetical protein [Persephonella marina EX-H1]HCB69596.1 hypothetical protein [Persephonella sp.]
MKKKKTYVFEKDTLKKLEQIKELTGKSETQILKDAIDLYLNLINDDKEGLDSIKDITDKLVRVVDRLEILLEKLLDK